MSKKKKGSMDVDNTVEETVELEVFSDTLLDEEKYDSLPVFDDRLPSISDHNERVEFKNENTIIVEEKLPADHKPKVDIDIVTESEFINAVKVKYKLRGKPDKVEFSKAANITIGLITFGKYVYKVFRINDQFVIDKQ